MRVAIVGSPTFEDATRVFPLIATFLDEFTHSGVTIVTGNMAGVERLAGKFAHQRGLDCITFRPVKPADNTYQQLRQSVFIRNKHMVDNADKILAIWDGQSFETEHIIKYARAKEVATMIVTL